jgi:hypothetical protein
VKYLFIIAALLLTAGTPLPLNEPEPNWIFRCDGHGNVYITDDGRRNFTVRGAWPPFYLTWIKEDEPELWVETGKCELIYPVEQG